MIKCYFSDYDYGFVNPKILKIYPSWFHEPNRSINLTNERTLEFEFIMMIAVKPIMEVAGIKTDVVYTEYSGHAGDYVRVCTDLFKYSSIVTISGL